MLKHQRAAARFTPARSAQSERGHQVELCIEVDSTDLDDMASLAEWLRQEPGIGGSVRTRSAPIAPNAMGGPVELIMAIGSLGLTKAFVTVMTTWLKTRRSNVRLVIRGANGKHVEIRAGHVTDPEKLVREIADLEESGDDSTTV